MAETPNIKIDVQAVVGGIISFLEDASLVEAVQTIAMLVNAIMAARKVAAAAA